VTLDECCSSERYAMAKLDIEGAEPLALRGARRMLEAGNPPVLQIELDGYSQNYGITSEAFLAELAEAGYACGYYEPAMNEIRFTARPWELGLRNILAIAESATESVRARIQSCAA
jgi:hypothetical protein